MSVLEIIDCKPKISEKRLFQLREALENAETLEDAEDIADAIKALTEPGEWKTLDEIKEEYSL